MIKRVFTQWIVAMLIATPAIAQTELLKYGNFDTWVTRNIKESAIIGGQAKVLHEVGPEVTLEVNEAYSMGKGGSPWATSNVMAKVAGVVKTNSSVFREKRGNGYCVRLQTGTEKCVVMGLVNIKVLAAGSLWLGGVMEPITSSSSPMSKLVAGIPFTKRPKTLVFDYKVKLSGHPDRIRETGFSRVTKVEGIDMADVMLLLQKRWEDEKGNLYAQRIGTLVVRYDKSTPDWINGAQYEIHYGDITRKPFYKEYMGLIDGEQTKYGRNSKGKNVAIKEVGWADAHETPTHMILQFDSSHGGAYVGSVGNTMWIDNVGLTY